MLGNFVIECENTEVRWAHITFQPFLDKHELFLFQLLIWLRYTKITTDLMPRKPDGWLRMRDMTSQITYVDLFGYLSNGQLAEWIAAFFFKFDGIPAETRCLYAVHHSLKKLYKDVRCYLLTCLCQLATAIYLLNLPNRFKL